LAFRLNKVSVINQAAAIERGGRHQPSERSTMMNRVMGILMVFAIGFSAAPAEAKKGRVMGSKKGYIGGSKKGYGGGGYGVFVKTKGGGWAPGSVVQVNNTAAAKAPSGQKKPAVSSITQAEYNAGVIRAEEYLRGMPKATKEKGWYW